MGALKLPVVGCVDAAGAAGELEAAAPEEVESGDPAACAAVCGEAAADGNAPGLTAVAAVVTPGVAPVPVVLPASVLSVWLMSISCSRLFTLTSWLMYSLGSVSEVGS